MSKGIIRKITPTDEALIRRIPHYDSTKKYYTLIDKEGHFSLNEEDHAVIYKCSLADIDLCNLEAYACLQYWAEEECSFKKISAIELLFNDFSSAPIRVNESDYPTFEIENYEKEFNISINAKPLRRLNKSIIDLRESLSEVKLFLLEKDVSFTNVFEAIQNYNENADNFGLSEADLFIFDRLIKDVENNVNAVNKRANALSDYMEEIFDGRDDNYVDLPEEDFEEEVIEKVEVYEDMDID